MLISGEETKRDINGILRHKVIIGSGVGWMPRSVWAICCENSTLTLPYFF